jgi:hypothetical protein
MPGAGHWWNCRKAFVVVEAASAVGSVEGMCHWPWGSIVAGAHVSCATGQESTVCLCMCLGSFLFDPFDTPFHIYHLPSISDVAYIHHDGLPRIYSPYGTL